MRYSHKAKATHPWKTNGGFKKLKDISTKLYATTLIKPNIKKLK